MKTIQALGYLLVMVAIATFIISCVVGVVGYIDIAMGIK